jgi:sorting nexin-29
VEGLIPDEADVDTAILRQRNNRAPGIDGILVELFKANEAIKKEMYKLIVKIWKTEQIPQDWKYSILCPVYKNEGDKLSCQNYRGISLLCTGYNVFTTLLKNKLEIHAEQIIGAYQAGFRKGKSAIDQLFSVKLILQKFWEYKIDVHHIFVDFKQAYDKINRRKLYKIMLFFGIPLKLVRISKVTMEDSAFQVKIQSEPTTTRKGLKQGDGLAPLLCNIVLEYIIRKSNINTDGTLICKPIHDVNIMARTQRDLKNTYILLEQNAKKVGLRVSATKTKAVRQPSYNNPTEQNIIIGEQGTDAVQHFT